MKMQLTIGVLLLTGFILSTFLMPFDKTSEIPPPEALVPTERLGPAVSVEASDSLLAWKDGLMRYQNQPFSGNRIEQYDDSRTKASIEYVNGKRDGVAMQWYPDGIVKEVRYYASGTKVGVHTGWWPNGEIRFSYAFSEGQYHGDFREWYDSGQPAKAFYYKDGHETGPQKAWRENGKLYINLVYKNGRRYGIARQKPCFTIVDGKRKGVGDEQYDLLGNPAADDSRMSVQ